MSNSLSDRTEFKHNCSMLAAALWIASAVTLFLFGKGSRLLWLSDTLLICGSWPLLYYWTPSWPWITFGICNLVLGIEIAILAVIPASGFPAYMIPVQRHILEHHQLVPWLLLGLISILYGIGRATKNLVLRFK
jgi:hypothetical protein